jgi:hypothetical protein
MYHLGRQVGSRSATDEFRATVGLRGLFPGVPRRSTVKHETGADVGSHTRAGRGCQCRGASGRRDTAAEPASRPALVGLPGEIGALHRKDGSHLQPQPRQLTAAAPHQGRSKDVLRTRVGYCARPARRSACACSARRSACACSARRSACACSARESSCATAASSCELQSERTALPALSPLPTHGPDNTRLRMAELGRRRSSVEPLCRRGAAQKSAPTARTESRSSDSVRHPVQ